MSAKEIRQMNFKRRKSKEDLITEEAFKIMKSISTEKKAKDEYTLFGEQVAIKLRKLSDNKAKATVQHVINTVLWQAELGKYDGDCDLSSINAGLAPNNLPFSYNPSSYPPHFGSYQPHPGPSPRPPFTLNMNSYPMNSGHYPSNSFPTPDYEMRRKKQTNFTDNSVYHYVPNGRDFTKPLGPNNPTESPIQRPPISDQQLDQDLNLNNEDSFIDIGM